MPMRVRSARATCSPASAIASAAATHANWLKRSIASPRVDSKCLRGSKRTCAATRFAPAAGPSRRAMPERPAIRLSKNVDASLPSADSTPTPVTATRLITAALSSGLRLGHAQALDQRDKLRQRVDALGFLRNPDVEGFLDIEQELDRGKRVDA